MGLVLDWVIEISRPLYTAVPRRKVLPWRKCVIRLQSVWRARDCPLYRIFVPAAVPTTLENIRPLAQHRRMHRLPAFSLFVLAVLLLAASPALLGAPADSSVTKGAFGATQSGEPVELYTLQNARGLRAQVMTYGAIIYSLEVPDRDGRLANVTINRETVTDYEKRSACFGALLGRYANRIGQGRIT